MLLSRRATIAVAMALFALGGAIGVLLMVWSRPTEQSTGAARLLWEQQALLDYQVVVVEQTSSGVCQQTLQVRNERVTEILANNCGHPPDWTITRLFRWLELIEQRGRQGCFPSPQICACRVSTDLDVRFDQQLGYPTEIRYRWQMTTNWSNIAYWNHVAFNSANPGCQRPGFGGDLMMQIFIEPLEQAHV